MTRSNTFSILLLLSQLTVASAVNAKTTVLTYSYNADGALTAVTTEVDEEAATTTYLTWDDFTPDATTPSTGTVSVGDGRLAGYGPSPGTSGLTASFQYDPRDRLLSFSGDAGAETYDYHASGMLMSSSVDSDDFLFYYDTGQHPRVTNIHETGPDLWSAYLDQARFLNDGSEEILLRPRKDTACTYDPASETLQSYVYDAFGSTDDDLTGAYDLHENPFRYSGEYRDPIWGGYFLRARWYQPDLPSFLSRDPDMHLNRYAYGAGNPVMNTDPSGLSAKWFKGVEHFLRSVDRKLNSGIGGHFARIFLAPLLGPLQIAAYPNQFWHSVKTDQNGIDIFLALGVVSEVGGGVADSYLAGYAVSLGKRFAARTASDLTIGIGSSVAAGANHGFRHFDWNSFTEGAELSASPIVTRGLTGFNVRSGFRLSSNDVAELAEQLKNAPDDTALVFRQKKELPASLYGRVKLSLEKPFQQALHLGQYHERLIAFTKDELFMNDAIVDGIRVSATEFEDFAAIQKGLRTLKGKFEFVGKVENFESESGRQAFLSNPRNALVAENNTELQSLRNRTYKVHTYNLLTNNCQHHAYAVLREMGLR